MINLSTSSPALPDGSPSLTRRSGRPRRHILGTGIAALIMVGLCQASAALVGDIDSFSTNQSALTLTFPPAGTSASSSVSGAGILGGERDIQLNLTGGVIAGNTASTVVSSGFFSYSQDATISGNAVIQWDGVDGSPALNPTGLGGVDLTGGGTQNKFQLGVFFDDLPANVTVTVYTDAGNASSMTTTLPGLIFSSANVTFDYSSFTTILGAGANFANVGAITLSLGSNVTAPDVVFDYFSVAPPGANHWLGQTDGTWSGNNWAIDAAGTPTTSTPTSADDVTFSATGAAHQNTTLDANFTIHSLTIQDPAAVTISGANTLTLSGDAGTGIDVQSGAGLFTLNSDLFLAGASNTITVDNLAGAVINGAIGGANGLTKLGSGTLTLTGLSAYTGNTNIDGGAVLITGAITNTDQFYVGYSNSGVTTTISGGGMVTDVSGTVGVSAGATNNLVTVTGIGSTWTSTGDLNVGFDGYSNTLSIEGGGQVFANFTKIGGGVDAVGNALNIDGTGSALNNTNDLIVGYSGSENYLSITGGATATNVNAFIGLNIDASDNSVVVSDTGSLWTNTGTLYIGDAGSGNALSVLAGGKVTVDGASQDAVIGLTSDSWQNLLEVVGAGSHFSNSSTLYVGDSGSFNELDIAEGGLITSKNVRIGFNSGSQGNTALVDGAGSNWNISGTLRVGSAGDSNELEISDGGVVNVTGNTFVGYAASGNNNLVLVDGPGSTWNVQALTIGRAGQNNAVILTDGGHLSATSITIADLAGSSGLLYIGLGGAPGTLDVPVINGGAGDALVIFAHDATGYIFDPLLTGSIGIWNYGPGETILTNANTMTGDSMIFGGTLRTENNSALGTSALEIDGGILAATGSLTLQSLKWNAGNVQLAPAAGDIVHVTTTLTHDVGSTGGQFLIDTAGIAQATYTLATFPSTDFTLPDFSALAANPNVTLQYQIVLHPASDVQITILSAQASGPILQNSAPVGIPTFADFTVNGPVTTGGPGESNTVQTLTFLPGSSLLIHQNLNVTQGPVTLVSGSSISLDGSLTASQLNLLPGGLLNGNGSIIGNLVNGGLVSPGHSPGQIHVTGNYTQMPTGTLRIEIAGRDLAQHDLLSVGGTAKLDGTLQLVPLDGFKLKRNKSVTFLTANEGVSGKFASVLSEFSQDNILQPGLVYGANSVAVEGVQGSFAALAGLTSNQKSVAHALDSSAGDRRADSLFEYLDYRKLNKLPGDFDKISPEELTSVFTIGVSLAQVQAGNIQRRTDDIRSGTSGFSAAGLAVNGSGPSYSGSFNIASGVAGPSGDDGKESKEIKSVIAPEIRWGTFLSGTGEWVSVGNTDNARGYDLSSGGFTLGVDYKVTPNLAIGLAAGYTGTTADLTDRGRVWVNGGKIGLYGTFFQNAPVAQAPTMSKDSSKEAPAPAPSIAKGFYADVAVFGGYNSYDTRRASLQGEARGDTDGGELNALFGAGYDFKKGGLTFGPTASFNYTYIGTDGFTEHGSLAPLNVHGGEGESLRTAFGFKASYDWKVGSVLIKPEIRAAWQHEFGDAAYALDSSFANGAGNSFLVNGPQLGRDSALLGAGFAIQCSERCSTYLYYDGELGRRNYQSTSVTGGFRLAF